MSHEPSKMLIEAGVIPKNTLKELVRWRFLPEGSEELHGARPVDPKDREQFVKDLSEAITKDMAEIRETSLDVIGCFKTAWVHFKTGKSIWKEIVVDKLGRVITPSNLNWKELESVFFDDSDHARKVVKREPRYEGDTITSLVHYLEP